MILQFGSFLGSLVSGIGSGLSSIVRAVAPTALGIGQQFLQREVNRKLNRRQQSQIGAQAIAVRNTPGISVARIGGTIQPVGGRVQRSTFTPAALTTAQNPIGNIPLLPVGRAAIGATFPLDPFEFRKPVQALVRAIGGRPVANGLAVRAPGAPGEPRFAKDETGRTIMFVPSPRPGEGFITVNQARQLNLSPTKPFWRFNRLEGQFEKIKRRRMNPFNFRAADRAGRRIDRTLEAVKGVVKIAKRKDKGVSVAGQVISFRTKKKKK